MMDKITFGIMGFGKIAKVHLLAMEYANLFLDLPYEIRVKYLVGTKERQVNHSGEYTTDYIKVLSDKEVDVIDICTPNHNHYENVKAGILAGKHIYCEKPLASNIEDARCLEDLAKKYKGYYNLALMYRAMPSIKTAKAVIKDGLLGEIINFRGQLFHKSYLNPEKSGWRISKEAGGGAALDLGVHLVDALNYIFSDEIIHSEVEYGLYFKDKMEVDDNSTISLKLKNGGIGKVEVSRIFAEPIEKTTFNIYGTKGSLSMSTQFPRSLTHYDFESDTTKIIPCVSKIYPDERNSMGYFFDCHMGNIVEYCNQIYYNRNSNEIGSFSDGVKIQELIK